MSVHSIPRVCEDMMWAEIIQSLRGDNDRAMFFLCIAARQNEDPGADKLTRAQSCSLHIITSVVLVFRALLVRCGVKISVLYMRIMKTQIITDKLMNTIS